MRRLLCDTASPHHAPRDPSLPAIRSPRTYGHLAMRRSTLDLFITGPARARPLQDQLDLYLGRWRKRAAALAADPRDDAPAWDLPVAAVADSLPAILGCPPPFALCEPRGRPCDRPSVCPSCWARRVAALWSEVDRGVFAGGRTAAGITMVCCAARHVTPFPVFDPDGVVVNGARPLKALVDYRLDVTRGAVKTRGRRRKGELAGRKVEIRRLREGWVDAGLDATTAAFAPVAFLRLDDALGPAWRLTIARVLFGRGDPPADLLARLGAAPGIGGTLAPGVATCRVVASPSRRAVALAVAAALPCPRSAFFGAGRAGAAAHVAAFAGRRPAVTFGDFSRLR